VWIGLISIESTDMFSSQNTQGMLYSLVTRLFGEVNLYYFLVFHFYLRKGGHVIGYGMLALLLLRGWRATLGRRQTWIPRLAALSWLGTALVASMDEWHQSFIPSRTGTIRDVLLDAAAGLIFLAVALFWLRRSDQALAPGSAQQGG
jgi:VanZ family protein